MGLPAILFACGLLAMATGVVGAYAINNLNAMTREQVYDQAHYASYSGIQWALSQVSADPRISSDGPTHYIGDLQFASNPELSCKVYIFSNLASAATKCTMAPDGTVIPPNLIYVVCESQLQGQTATRSAQLSALCTPKQYYFDNPLFALSGVEVLGASTVDAYTGGTFLGTPSSPILTDLDKASLATNETAAGSIKVAGTSLVKGKGLVGKSGDATLGVVIDPTATLEGGKSNLAENQAVKLDHTPGKADVSLPLPPATGPQNVSGVQHFIAGKTYLINGDFNMAPGSSVVVDPNPAPQGLPQENNAFVFIQGNVNIDQAVVGSLDDKAERLQFYIPRSIGHTFTVNNSKGSFVVCGPDTIAMIKGGSEIQGAVIAEKVTLDSSKIHYDTKLAGAPKGPMGWAVGGFDSDNKKNQTGGNFGPGPAPAPVPGPGPGPVPGPGPGPAPYSPPTSTTPPYTSSSTMIP